MTDRRAQIVDAAGRLMGQRGFAATSVDDVIREAKLSGKSHFYHYFRSKDELGYAVLARQFDRFTERGLAVLREPMIEPLERLALFVDTLVALQVARGCRGGSPLGALAAELADAHDGFRERIALVFERWAAQLQSLLWEARPRLVEGVDTARLARFVVATLEGALLMARVHRDPAALEGIAHDLKRFVAMHVREPAGFAGAPGGGGGAGAGGGPDAAPPGDAPGVPDTPGVLGRGDGPEPPPVGQTRRRAAPRGAVRDTAGAGVLTAATRHAAG